MGSEKGVGAGRGSGSKAGQFKPGHPGRAGAKPGETGPQKGQKKPPQLLLDMRAVFRGAEETDRGPAQKELRAFLKEDRGAFVRQMASLEKAHCSAVRQEKRARDEYTVEEEMLRTEELLKMLNRVLAKSQADA